MVKTRIKSRIKSKISQKKHLQLFSKKNNNEIKDKVKNKIEQGYEPEEKSFTNMKLLGEKHASRGILSYPVKNNRNPHFRRTVQYYGPNNMSAL